MKKISAGTEKKLEILVVDDSEVILDYICDIINKNLDVNIYRGKSAKEALRLLGNHNIDLILMDVFMPGIDGFKAARIIKKQRKTSFIPLIFITGSDPKKELENTGFDTGGIDYLTKPFTDQELIRLLNLYFRFIKREHEVNREIKEANELLKAEIFERVKIEQALKKLNVTKDKFFSIISHDLKNPLGSFKNSLELLVNMFDELSKDELKDFLEPLSDSASKIFKLLEDLLTWSRMQSGKIPYLPENIDLSLIINNTISFLKINSDVKKQVLISEVQDNTMAFIDENMITTVIRNLVSNSIKFTGEGGIIRICSRILTEDEYRIYLMPMLEISITDNGIGLSKEDLVKLFRIDVSHTTIGTSREKGTGLGLIMCREFVEKHGGKIWAESEYGNGSTFKFLIPKAKG